MNENITENYSKKDAGEFPDIPEIPGYELRELLGKGGFGAVYLAYQKHVQREVALKIILPQYANSPDFIRRFEAEAHVVARLEHPFIVPLFDFWRDPSGAYLVMRYLRGGSLEGLLEKGPLDLELAARILDQVASALSLAHRSGVIHQDMKPANILLDNDQNAYLTDFGIAKEVSKATPGQSDDQPRQGTLHYISPEQLSYTPVSPRSDIYSLGIMLYELLTGEPPFEGKNLDDMVYKHLYENVPSVQFRRPDLPEDINRIIAQATAKNPRARYADAIAIASEFREILLQAKFGQPAAKPTPAEESAPAKKREFSIADIPLDPPNPYKGLRPFQEADAVDFFGRSTLIEKLLKRLQAAGAHSSFLAVVGASGSGKSSVVKAGLIPALKKGALQGSQNWFYIEITPRKSPLAELGQALLKVATRKDMPLSETLNAEDGYGLYRAVDLVLPDEQTELVLVIDQFEELYTLTEDENERNRFLHMLVKAAGEALSRLWIIITLRADFMDRPLQHQEFGNMLTERAEFVLPMSAKELEQAIVGPAERVGLKLESSLVSAIVTDINKQPGALPLLQYALMELFNARKGITLTLDAYTRMGGVSGALARRADELYQPMKNENRQAVKQMFLRLITLNEGAEATRRRILQSDLLSGADTEERKRLEQIMNTFAKYRLLTFDNEQQTRYPTVEIAHEALIREWQEFREWIRSSREELDSQRRLITASGDWANGKGDASFLASGARLEEFTKLRDSKTLILSEQESEFIAASLALRQRNVRRRNTVIAALVVLTIVAVLTAVLAFIGQNNAQIAEATAVAQRERAEENERTSTARSAALTAITNTAQTDLALLLSLGSLQVDDTFEGRNSLLTALLARPQLTRFLYGHEDEVLRVAFSPNARQPLLASTSMDETVRLWDPTTGQPLGQPLRGHTLRVNAIAFSPDASFLVSASTDTTLIIWDLSAGVENPAMRILSGHTQTVLTVAISPDGQTIASAGQDGTIMLWDAASGAVRARIDAQQNQIYSIAFSPDGQTLAAGGEDNSVRLWDIRDPAQASSSTIISAQAVIYSLAYSGDGRVLAAASGDTNVYLWNTQTQALLPTYPRLTNEARSVAFVPGAVTLAIGDANGNIFLWNYALGQQVGRLTNVASRPIRGLAFAPDGYTLASGGTDTTVLLWDIRSSQALAAALPAQTQPILRLAANPADSAMFAVTSGDVSSSSGGALALWDGSAFVPLLSDYDSLVLDAVFSPDGSQLVAGTLDQQILVYNVATRTEQFTFDSNHQVFALAYHPQRPLLAAGAATGGIFLWNITQDTLTAAGQLRGHGTDRISGLAFSPDGRILASGSFDRTIRLWNSDTMQPIGQPLSGHTDNITSIAFSPDGTLLASGCRDGTVRLWDVATGTQIGEALRPQSDWVLSVAFSPDGRLLATGTRARTVILWDVAARRMMGTPLVAHRGQVNALAFSADSAALFSGGDDAAIFRWDVDLDSWSARACRIANRPLTEDEWQHYIPNQPFVTLCSSTGASG
ncbi:MAG: protein kinase [Chloroflexi bacterium]|nr:protein kinase [Chloroflexota bacterium]